MSNVVEGSTLAGKTSPGRPPVMLGGVAKTAADTVLDGQVSNLELTLRGAARANLRDSNDNEIQFGTADDKVIIGGAELQMKRAFGSIAASQTDAAVVAAVTSKKIRVLQFLILAGATATDITFNSKPAGAGAAISPAFTNDAKSGLNPAFCPLGWMETVAGEGLSATTGAGSATSYIVIYVEV